MFETSEFGSFKTGPLGTMPPEYGDVVAKSTFLKIFKKDLDAGIVNLPLTCPRGERTLKKLGRAVYYGSHEGSLFKISSNADAASLATGDTIELSSEKEAVEILKSSGRFRLIEASRLFKVSDIDTGMTLGKFKAIRKRGDVPIEDYLLKERYE